VPTVAELGNPGFDTASWIGIFLPASASDTTVTRLHDALAIALQDSVVRERLTGLGIILVGSTPQELGDFVKSEIARWTEVVKRYDIKGD
jgi:tripartite-type tricarboxylate transporter receptor subunit TctC